MSVFFSSERPVAYSCNCYYECQWRRRIGEVGVGEKSVEDWSGKIRDARAKQKRGGYSSLTCDDEQEFEVNNRNASRLLSSIR